MLQSGMGDINEMSHLGGRGDSDPAKKMCSFQQELDESKGLSQPLETSWDKALHESQSRNSTGGDSWKEMEQDEGKPILKSHHWFQPHLERPFFFG